MPIAIVQQRRQTLEQRIKKPVTGIFNIHGWRTLLVMLAYKAQLYGRQFITINPRNTTQTCSHCGFIMGTGKTEKLTLRDRGWTCPQCGKHQLRDENAAQNILAKGLASI